MSTSSYLTTGLTALAAAALACVTAAGVRAQSVYQVDSGTATWADANNWNPAGIPNAVGAAVTFNGAATGQNPEQTAARTVTLDGTKTVGSIVFNNDVNFANTVSTGSGGPLVLDAAGAGPATITTTGGGTGNNTISVAMTFTDSVVANVNQTTSTSGAGSLNITGGLTGPGGFTKNGDGGATFGNSGKSYTGPTVINGGRMRVSSASTPTLTAGFTVNAGAQLTPITTGNYNFGGGLILNGNGATSGPFAIFGGAVRPDRGLTITVTSPVVLQSDSVLHMEANSGTGTSNPPTGTIALANTVSGPGKLIFTAPNSDIDAGVLTISAANTYTGGTLVNGGILSLASPAARLGSGNVEVNNAASPLSIAQMQIAATVVNGIADYATLSLAGGGAPASADQGYLDISNSETVGGLILGGVVQGVGTYGSTASPAMFQNDEYFAGMGVLTVALPGDFNHDNKVDGADFAKWTGDFGPGNIGSDADADGDSDGFDFLVWQRKFGAVSPSAVHAVPEPAAALMVTIAIVAAAAALRGITPRFV